MTPSRFPLEAIFSDPQLSHIVFDHSNNEYYNKQTDIYLSDDDIAYLYLPPTALVPHLRNPLITSIAAYQLSHPRTNLDTTTTRIYTKLPLTNK